MEIEGIMREVDGDNGAIKVHQRDNLEREKGDVLMANVIQIQDNAGGKEISEIVVMDPKRRRLDEEEVNGENNGHNSMHEINQYVNGPKNLQLAGPGSQARPSS